MATFTVPADIPLDTDAPSDPPQQEREPCEHSDPAALLDPQVDVKSSDERGGLSEQEYLDFLEFVGSW